MHSILLAVLLVPDIPVPQRKHRTHQAQRVAFLDRDRNWSAENREHWDAIRAAQLSAKKWHGEK